MGWRRAVVAGGMFACLAGLAAFATHTRAAEESASREIPEAFAPFEYLIGSWKGAGYPIANKVRGWEEKHSWAWKFEKGTPVGMSVELTGDKVLSSGKLTYDPASKRYLLAGTDPDGKPVTFAGTFHKTGRTQTLTLDRGGTTAEGAKQRLTLYPNANFIRYTFQVDEQERGAPQFKAFTRAGLTKEGEAFAAGSSASNLPKCIITGGAATMTVSYQGKSYPLCCSGCRDEFNENPAKYIKKAALRAEDAASKPAMKRAPARANKDDGAFDGLVVEPKPAPKAKSSGARKKAEPDAADAPADPPAAPKAADAARAASTLRLGQNLDRAGKTAAALDYYRRVVKDYPDTPSAKTAAARIKALGGK